MATLKAWYWAGLGVLALSFATSSTGRCWMDFASSKLDEARLRTMPYVAVAEMALGHTQSGYARAQASAARMQASVARIEAQRARLEAVQARWEEQRARTDAANQVMLKLQHVMPTPQQFVDQSMFDGRDFVAPSVRVMSRSVVVNGRHHRVVVCPGTPADVVVPEVSTPRITALEDPI